MMRVDQIWRYPVKSMGGERLEEGVLTEAGVEGDRLVQVYDASGRLVTARRYPRLLRHRVETGPEGAIAVDGRPWDSEAVARDLAEDVGPGARLVRSDVDVRFDVLPLLVATDGSLAAFGYDARRLRPNLVIAGVDGLTERGWEGRLIQIGDAVIGLDSLRGRCVMTTIDPDTNAQDLRVLESIVERFEGRLCLNAWVERPGKIRAGDPVELLSLSPAPR